MVSKGRQAERVAMKTSTRAVQGPVVYVEGGAKGQLQRNARRAFGKLFAQLALSRNPTVVACGARDDAFRKFKEHIESKRPEPALLLVDSEDVFDTRTSHWQHVKKRDPSWEKPGSATDEHLFFMAVVMETWCLADGSRVTQWLGLNGEQAVPRELECLPKADVYKKLSALTQSQWSEKTKVASFDFLEQVRVGELEKHCLEFKRLTAKLRELASE